MMSSATICAILEVGAASISCGEETIACSCEGVYQEISRNKNDMKYELRVLAQNSPLQTLVPALRVAEHWPQRRIPAPGTNG